MSEPIPHRTTVWRCPHCLLTRLTKMAMTRHIARCWRNPAAKACKTCVWFESLQSEPAVGYFSAERCRKGLEFPLSDRGVQTLAVHCDGWEPNAHTTLLAQLTQQIGDPDGHAR